MGYFTILTPLTKGFWKSGGAIYLANCFSTSWVAKKWVSVDLIGQTHYAFEQQTAHYGRETIHALADAASYFDADKYVIFDGRADYLPQVFEQQFDAVVSITAFEHMSRLSAVIRQAYKALKPAGILFSYHGPIWSCAVGHHCWVRDDLNFNRPGPLFDFAHLLLRPAEMYKLLSSHYPPDVADEAVEQIYFSERINRLFFEDYEMLMRGSNFCRFTCEAYGAGKVEPDILGKLTCLYPRNRQFHAYGCQIVAFRDK